MADNYINIELRVINRESLGWGNIPWGKKHSFQTQINSKQKPWKNEDPFWIQELPHGLQVINSRDAVKPV